MTEEQKTEALPADSDLDPDSMAAIRDLMDSEAEPAPAPKRRRKAKPAPAPETAIVPEAMPVADAAAHAFEPLADSPEPTPKKPARKRLKVPSFLAPHVDRLKAKVLGYRPTPKHIIVASLVLLVLFRPWLVVGLILLFAFILTAIFLILGYDGFWRNVMRVARWYARRHPSRSAELHRKLDDFAVKFDAFLDRFPEGSVDGLYLPDLGDLTEADKRHDEALDRRFETLRET